MFSYSHLLLCHFCFTFILCTDFNWCPIFTECCFWLWNGFKWSKSVPFRFPPLDKEIFSSLGWMRESPLPLSPIWKTLYLETAMTPKICPKMSNRLIQKVKKVSHVYSRKNNRGGDFSGLLSSAWIVLKKIGLDKV